MSVVVATHNRHRSLARTLLSLSSQTLLDFEVVVVDDGSDSPVGCDAGAGPAIVRVLRLPRVERSAARNAGAEAAHGRVVVFLDDDMIADRNLLAAHSRAHDRWPRALIVGAIELPTEFGDSPFGRFRRALEADGVPITGGPVAEPNFATAANMSMDRNLFLRLGGFDATLVSAEDQDLAMRHSAAGGSVVFVPDARAVHDDHVQSLRDYCYRHEWGAEHMAPFVARYPDLPANRERVQVNGAARFGDPLPRLLRKAVKRILGMSAGCSLVFGLADFAERASPGSRWLPAVYRLALGIHLQRGFRRGWALRSLSPSGRNQDA